MIDTLIIVMGAYLVGALPIGFLIARIRGIVDIRNHGSGNIGATNVARVLGAPYFILVFLLDAGKAYIFMYLVSVYTQNLSDIILASIALLFGNTYSFFLRGAGGKGVATGYGILFAIAPLLALLQIISWIIVFAITKTVGIASVIAYLLLPWYAWYSEYDYRLIMCMFFMSLLITWRHKTNIHNYLV